MLAASSVLASQQALAAPLGNPKTVRPEDFGAKGDGLADDTNPIQKAINYVFKNKCSNQCKCHNIHVCGQDFYSNKKVKFT